MNNIDINTPEFDFLFDNHTINNFSKSIKINYDYHYNQETIKDEFEWNLNH